MLALGHSQAKHGAAMTLANLHHSFITNCGRSLSLPVAADETHRGKPDRDSRPPRPHRTSCGYLATIGVLRTSGLAPEVQDAVRMRDAVPPDPCGQRHLQNAYRPLKPEQNRPRMGP